MNSALLRRYRLAIVHLCCGALLLLGLGSQLHGLAHALQATQAAAHHGAAGAHTQACDQCVQYAALDGAAPVDSGRGIPPAHVLQTLVEPRSPQAAAARVAYRSRAPPATA